MYEQNPDSAAVPDRPVHPEWATPEVPSPPDATCPAPLPPPPERISYRAYEETPSSSPARQKIWLIAGLALVLTVGLGLGWAYTLLSIRPNSPFYSPERAVRYSIDCLNRSVKDHDFEEFSRYCDVQGVSAGLAASSMDDTRRDMYILEHQLAGASEAKKSWEADWEERRQYAAWALEQAVRTGQVPGPEGLKAPRYYNCFCSDVLSVTFSEDGTTARVRALSAGNFGDTTEGEFDMQHVGGGTWRIVALGPDEPQQ